MRSRRARPSSLHPVSAGLRPNKKVVIRAALTGRGPEGGRFARRAKLRLSAAKPALQEVPNGARRSTVGSECNLVTGRPGLCGRPLCTASRLAANSADRTLLPDPCAAEVVQKGRGYPFLHPAQHRSSMPGLCRCPSTIFIRRSPPRLVSDGGSAPIRDWRWSSGATSSLVRRRSRVMHAGSRSMRRRAAARDPRRC